MITRVKSIVKRVVRVGQLGKFMFMSGILVLLLMILGTTGVLAQDSKPATAVGCLTKEGEISWIIPGKDIAIIDTTNLSISDLENMYPMSKKIESSIVHSIPVCPVIIDGIRYNPDQISKFDGMRLRFVMGKDDNLYAFTTLQGFEQFRKENFKQPLSLKVDIYSYFFRDISYGGDSFSLVPGRGLPDLSQIGMDNAVSSTKINTSTQWAYLFDYINFGGDWFGMPPGSSYSTLVLQGWNDRASSASINP